MGRLCKGPGIPSGDSTEGVQMLQALRELAGTLGGTGIDIATRAVSGMVDLLKNIATLVGDQIGVGGPGGGAGGFSGPGTRPPSRMIPEPPASSATPAAAAAAAAAPPDSVPAEKPAAKAGAAAGKGRARPPTRKKAPARKKGPARAKGTRKGKTAKGRKAAANKDQLVRVLRHIVEGDKEWMSAGELSQAAAAANAPMLPGNVRKVIRLRGEGLVQTRPRADSRRGSLEYRITAAGRKRLEEAGA